MFQSLLRPPARTRRALPLVLAALAACSRPAPAEGPAPMTLAAADPIVAAVQPTPRGVRVIARVEAPDVGGDTVRAAARAARQIARAVQAGARDLPAGAERVTLELYGTDVDKFGKRSFGRLFAVDFEVGDLKGLDLKPRDAKALGPAGVLDRAVDLRIDPAGRAPIAAWCMRYPHVGGDLCDMAGE